jgi:hypothetical protein
VTTTYVGSTKTTCTLVSKQGKIYHFAARAGSEDYTVVVRPDNEGECVEAFAPRKLYPSVRPGDRLTLVRGWYLAWPRIRPLRTATAGGSTEPPTPLPRVVSVWPASGKRRGPCTVLSKEGQVWFQVFNLGGLAYGLVVRPEGEDKDVEAGAQRDPYDSVKPGDRLMLRRREGLWPGVERPHRRPPSTA